MSGIASLIPSTRDQGRFTGRLPDGLDNLAAHNLITFKSHQEALDDWALKELTGHYVNYRKQVSRSPQKLLPEAEIHLYAVSSRFPHNLANLADWRPVQDGVYECRRGSDVIRVVVLAELPQTENNAPLHFVEREAGVSRIWSGALRTTFAQHEHVDPSVIRGLQEGGDRHALYHAGFSPRLRHGVFQRPDAGAATRVHQETDA